VGVNRASTRPADLHKKTIALNPNCAILYNDIGMAYFETGDLVTASDYFVKVAAISPNDAMYYENLQMVQKNGRGEEEENVFGNGVNRNGVK
jgi:Flp pilus assembly protein TadD